jgi:adenosine deaminase
MEDGVCYLELRTTPRAIPAENITKEEYINIVLQAIHDFEARLQKTSDAGKLHTRLILSVDRKNTLEEALEVVNLALRYRHLGIVGIDLCGNPARKPISHLAPAFGEAAANNLPITLHFAEIAQSGSGELEELLSWNPQRIGHVIHVPLHLRKIIKQRQLGLELCVSCNVLANLSKGGFAAHHFGEWWGVEEGSARQVPIALSTDDVGIFESGLSNEYLLVAEHFGLDCGQLVELSRGAVDVIFGGKEEKDRMLGLIKAFASSM